jgi:ABC-type glycerol-3-phosphate transport system substrate-binding protein
MAQGSYPAGKVTLWSWGTPQLQTDWMNDFLTAKYPDAGITGEAVGQAGAGEIQQMLMTDFAAGGTTLPDFVQSEPSAIHTLAKAGVLIDLTDWVGGIKDKMPDGIFNLWTIDEKVYAFPWRPNTWLMYYNRDIFDKAGVNVDEINTWDDWVQAGIKIKTATNGESLLEYRNGGSYWHTAQQLVPQAGGRYIDGDMNVVIDTDPATVEVFTHLERLYKEGLIYQTTDFDPGWYQSFRDGKISAIHYGNWFDEFLKQNLPEMAGKWGLMPLPAFSNGNHKGAMEAVPFGIINKSGAAYTDLIKEMLEWQFLDPERVIAYLHIMTDRKLPAFLPVLKSAYADPFMTAVDPYYGDQSFQAAAAESTVGAVSILDPTLDGRGEIATVIDTELSKVYTGDQDMAMALKNMHDGIDRALPDILDARG